ncbi:MAG: methylthioribose kinase [Bacillaceae bacterium]|nr:methylthioribose kinase [Bacillaceae bacterium]
MIQRFIELGEGYSDIYELIELARHNKDRVEHLFMLHTKKAGKEVTSFSVIMKPTKPGDFQAMYICLEGIPNPNHLPNKRHELFESVAEEIGKNIIEFDIKPSNFFAEKALFFQYLIGILRMNRFIPPLQ